MKKTLCLTLALAALMALPVACSLKKNTAVSRRYHAINARYNTYFNGKTSFDESLEAMNKGYKENYTERILMYPVSAQPKDKKDTGGQFDRAIEKGNKAIKRHSIQQKPARKANWKSDPKQLALQSIEEYNPFLKHCWMLVAQAQFYNADFLQASATFSYITRHYSTDPEMVAEARIWQARCYAEMDWLFEAGSIFDNLAENGFPESGQKDYDRYYADLLIKSDSLQAAIPYLLKAIKTEKNKRQKSRMRYLLGQIYAETGDRAAAYAIFRKVAASNPPYELEFAARIRQTEVFPGNDSQKILKMLKRMAKSDKNKDYLDQVYYAIGNIYMNRQDTANAITNYALGVEKSTQNGLDKAICNIRLGDIYYTQRDYVNAQPCFSDALSGLKKENADYERVYRLSAVLDELVVYVEAVHLQDSLQVIAKMPEAERLALIDKIIEDYIEEEKRMKEEAEKENYLAQQQGMGNMMNRPGMQQGGIGMSPVPGVGSGESSFYFYNPQTVAQGKVQFQSKWGKRANEDNWRRRNKTMVMSVMDDGEGATEGVQMQFDAEGNPIETTDSLALLMDSLSSDPKSREYYLQQIPLTEDDVEASNVIIADGLFNMGMIYKDKLENKELSVETFEELERRFPENKYRMDYYYHCYLMALRYKDDPLGEKYKAKLIEAFPESDYAIAISDPNYEYNIRMMDSVQDSIYATTYSAYLEGDTVTVRSNFKSFSETYPLSKLNPKFMFLYALTYVQAGDAEGFKAALQALVDKFPTADVSELANDMLKGVNQGRMLMQGNFSGMVWDMRFGLSESGMLSADDSARQFVDSLTLPHRIILVYEKGSVDRNQLLYTVAAFNFARFTVNQFDISIEDYRTISILTIGGFNHLDETIEYLKMAYAPDGYAESLGSVVAFFPISNDNFDVLMHGKTLEEYMAFFAEHYAAKAPELIARWRIRVGEDEAAALAEDESVERAAGLYDDEEEEEEAVPTIATADTAVIEQVELDSVVVNQAVEPDEILPEIADEIVSDSLIVEEDTVILQRPAEITLDQLLERRRLEDEATAQRLADEKKAKEQQRKDADALKKQQAKERKALQKQKEKERKALQQQKEKERKQKERDNKKRQQEKLREREAQRKAAAKKTT
ncbi:MAG: tetratricopeptide repeat protein [Tannerella sp.]|nr:tetratricopeptide repeat protein [Tannerella sp.]